MCAEKVTRRLAVFPAASRCGAGLARLRSLCGVGLLLSATVAVGGATASGERRHPSQAVATAGQTPLTQEMVGGGKATLMHPGHGGSPHVKVDWVVAGANISIMYGRPYLKGRVVGESVDPRKDRVWRLGADEATTLITDTDLMIGSTHVPAGAYTLWALDIGATWELIVSKETSAGEIGYDASQDLARIPMTVSETDRPAGQLTLSVTDGEFKIEWGKKVATVALQVH